VVLTGGLLDAPAGLRVARACPDVAELLAAAAAGVADAVLVSAELPGLDREVLARLGASGLAVVGLAGHEAAEARLRQLGLAHVRRPDSPELAQVVADAVAELAGHRRVRAFAHAAAPGPVVSGGGEAQPAGSGQVLAVWGPTGAPGRTTVAVGLASELSLLGWPVLLVDADPYGGAAAVHLGLGDEPSGLAAACRRANLGVLDTATLQALVLRPGPTLALLSGVPAGRWPELRPPALEVVLEQARSLAAVTVVDVGFCLEQDEELSYDTLAPRRNGATLTALEQADVVVAVGAGDPVALPRLVRGLEDLAEAVPGGRTTVVVNRVRTSAAEDAARGALREQAGIEHVAAVPEDGAACHAALRAGRPLAEVAAESAVRRGLQGLALALLR
jgi:Flp pilus assembly CpaE family ATPase